MSAHVPDAAMGPAADRPAGAAGADPGRAWLAALPAELTAQRDLITGLLTYCEASPLASALLIGCSLGRGAADALSDIDAALGVPTDPGEAGASRVRAAEAEVVAALPGLGPVVDVLRHQYGPADRFIRRIFAQFADRTQIDLTVMADAEIRRGGRSANPDFVWLYDSAGQSATPPTDDGGRGDDQSPAYAVTGDQVREWAFLGWCALIDLDKYLRRDSLWEAHNRLHEARHYIWALWAAATGAMYPWHGLSQVLDHDPGSLPPGIDATVAGLDAADLRRAAHASAALLADVSAVAASGRPTELPLAMAQYVTAALSPPVS